MEQSSKETSLSKALSTITDRVQELGFTHICPESLEALGDRLFDESEEVCRAYRQVIGGFRALFAPKEAA